MANMTPLLRTQLDALIGAPPTGSGAPDAATYGYWNSFLRLLRDLVDGLGVSTTQRTIDPDTYRDYPPVTRAETLQGRMWFISSPATMSGSGLKCFAVYVPRAYTVAPDGGHRVWLHFTPSWPEEFRRTPEGLAMFNRMASDFRAWRTDGVSLTGDPGFWVFKFLADYLFDHSILPASVIANPNVIFLLPMYDFTYGEALNRLGIVGQLRANLRSVLEQLEVLSPTLVRRTHSARGAVDRIGASAYSFGAKFLMRLLGSDRTNRVQGAAFLDGIANPEVDPQTRVVTPRTRAELDRLYRGVIERRGASFGGWFGQRIAPTARKRLIMCQQVTDFSMKYESILGFSPSDGDIRNFSPRPTTSGLIHRVRRRELHCRVNGMEVTDAGCPPLTTSMYTYHEDIERYFCGYAFKYCSDVFSP